MCGIFLTEIILKVGMHRLNCQLALSMISSCDIVNTIQCVATISKNLIENHPPYPPVMENNLPNEQVMTESYYDDMNDGDVLQDETQALSQDGKVF